MNILEIQFQIERSCRESAEALAVNVCFGTGFLSLTSQTDTPLGTVGLITYSSVCPDVQREQSSEKDEPDADAAHP